MKKKTVLLILAAFMASLLAWPAGAMAAAEEEANPVNHTLRAGIITIVNEMTNLFTPIASTTDEDYMPTSRKWNGMPSVIRANNNIFVAWQTGGVREPDPDHYNYVTVAVSTDGGTTWRDPFMIIDPPEEDRQATVPMFYYNHAGQLYLLFSYEGKGIHAIPIYNPGGSLENIRYGAPFHIGTSNSCFTKPTLMSDGSIMYASGTVDTRIFKSTNDGLSFSQISEVPTQTATTVRRFSESTLIEKENGMIWHLRRLENAANGGVEQSFSMDGITWTTAEGNLPSPLRSPGSRFNMQRLKSGSLLFVTNAAGMGMNRLKMTAYLSQDDGESWPYSILLDPLLTSYPDFYQHDDGTIYIAFDKDRYGEGGIRLCILTEEDVIAGSFSSDKAKQLIVITKVNYDYADIKSVNGAFDKVMHYKTGTSLESILSGLNTTIKVTDENGKMHEITGTYRVTGYKADIPGTYKAYFVTTLPDTLKDSFSMLEFTIVLEEKMGCGGSIGFAFAALPLMAIAGFAAFKKKR